MRKGFIIIISFFISISLVGQPFSLTVPVYNQNFDGLANSGTSSVTPTGWMFSESGTNANTTYIAGTGSSTTGDTYSFGSAASTERAFGGLRSGALTPTFGFYVLNNYGATITGVQITYTGEQWRLGTAGRNDTLNFQYSLNATTLTTGTWIDVDVLDFSSPTTTGPTGALDGNATANRTVLSTIITNLNISNGTSFFFRWNDFDASGADDGLSIDDFTLTVISSIPLSIDYYRSIATGPWNNISTWQISPDGNDPWIGAASPPDLNSKTITIRNGNTVTINSTVTADEIIIENGGVLENQTDAPDIFTVADGIGDDMNIQSGGIYRVTSAQSYSNSFSIASSATIHIQTGGIIEIGDGGGGIGSGNSAYASTATSFIWEDSSIFHWNTTITPGIQTTFFPDVNTTTIPIFRFSSIPSFSMGGNGATFINGILEPNVSISFQGTGNKTFRNGIRGAGNITYSTIGLVIIDGVTAVLGGTGGINVIGSGGLQIGSSTSTGTVVTMTNNKTVTGFMSLVNTGTGAYVEIGNNNLTVTQSIFGGSTTSYIRTNGTGSLILNNVGLTKEFPIGRSTFNRVTLGNGSSLDWSARVEDVLIVDDPLFASNTAGAVQRKWFVVPSTNPPPSGVDMIFEYNDDPASMPRQTGPSYNTSENVQVWHEVDHGNPWGTDWVAVGVAQIPTGTPDGIRTASISNWTWITPFAISTISFPLPIKLVAFDVTKISSTHSYLTWELAACCSKDAVFEIQKSTDSRNYVFLARVGGSETNRFYNYNDTHLEKGITYYRLKMTDVDGKVSYSKVIAVINDSKGVLITSIAPNPVADDAVLNISSAKQGNIHLAIYNMAGVAVKQWTAPVQEGNNAIHFNTGKLMGGIYHLVAISDDSRSVLRFVKQ